jgi:hypothetical protein
MRGRGLYAYLTIFLQKNTTRLHRIVAGTSAVPLHTQRLRESPDFFPRIAIVLGFQRDDAMLWEICNVIGLTGEQERQEARQVQEVTGDHDLTSFATQPVAEAPRRIVRLKIRRSGEFRERVAGPPVSMRRLACPKLAAVPDDGRSHASGRSLLRKSRRSRLANRRQRSA